MDGLVASVSDAWQLAPIRYATMALLVAMGLRLGQTALGGGLDGLAAALGRLTGRRRRRGGRAGWKGAAVQIDAQFARPGSLPVSALRTQTVALEDAVQGPEPDAVAALGAMLEVANAVGASDVHLAPDADGAQVTYRVDGMLYDVARVPRTALPRLTSRVKVAANLAMYVHDKPQDGRLVVEYRDRRAEVRVSVLPTSHGEKVVMRLHHASAAHFDLERLGLVDHVLEEARSLLARPQGLIFLTGPTGSGKTTTIYSALRHVRGTRGDLTNIVTIEDPIEFDIEGVSQTQVSPATGLTFADGLRSILRQDPDVIVVGEIRDVETGKIAMQAGLSGHLILTTIHAESAAGVFTRLINMGIEPFMLASATIGVVSQRLVRQNCPECRRPEPVSETHARLLERLGVADVDAETLRGQGCDRCLGKGLLGRTGIYELLVVGEEVREVITTNVRTGRIHAVAQRAGMRALLTDGLAKVRTGDVPLDEVLRVAM